MLKVGAVAILGQPNVGKSTLLNQILGESVSLVTHKSHTTQENVLGVYTTETGQAIFVDTPGFQSRQASVVAHYMDKQIRSSFAMANVLLYLVDARGNLSRDRERLLELSGYNNPLVVVMNKRDLVTQEQCVLMATKIQDCAQPEAIFSVSAMKGEQVPELLTFLEKLLPEASEYWYPPEVKTNKDLRYRLGQCLRSGLLHYLHQEVPYQCAVTIESWVPQGNCEHIHALIVVAKPQQKPLLLGSRGGRLKQIGRHARIQMEALLGRKVMLKIWVRVQEDWMNRPESWQSLGFGDE